MERGLKHNLGIGHPQVHQEDVLHGELNLAVAVGEHVAVLTRVAGGRVVVGTRGRFK